MKFTHRIPTAQYAYLEYATEHGSVEEAMAEHKRVTKLYEEQGDLSHREWVKIRNTMLATGDCDVNELERLSPSQRWFVNELKLALRAHTAPEPVIE
jgi:hypothetical protein